MHIRSSICCVRDRDGVCDHNASWISSGIATFSIACSYASSLLVLPSRTSSLDSNNMPDLRRDRQTGPLLRHPSVAVVAGTCPEAVVLVGSTWAVVADHIVPVGGRSLVLAAGMGRARLDNSRCRGPGCCNNLEAPSGPGRRTGHRGLARGTKEVVRPVIMSANIYARRGQGARVGVAQHGVELALGRSEPGWGRTYF
jgi:hypothetical protein